MVYCGKPSRGCQMCRTRRIKCDETKPTCNQCAKSRRVCPGYKDDFDLVFRNETQATERRARRSGNSKRVAAQISFATQQSAFSSSPKDESSPERLPTLIAPNPGVEASRALVPTGGLRTLQVPLEIQAPNFFVNNFVIAPRHESRGYFDFLLPMLKNERPDSHLQLAFGAVAMASLANRPNTRGQKHLFSQAVGQYTKALKATNLALQSAAHQKTDATLAAILMLGFFETVASERTSAMAWYSHVDGAVQLVKMRGKKQLRTKTGYSLFTAVRQQMLVSTLSGSKPLNMGTDWWTVDIERDRIGMFATRMSCRVAELRHELNNALSNFPRTPEYFEHVADIMHRAEDLEKECQEWETSLPDEWRSRAVAWVDQVPGGDLTKAEVFPGRVDMYSDVTIANIWNQLRVVRLFISGIVVRCAAWICAPVDYRTTPEYAQAVRLCGDLITDVVASTPYHLGWRVGQGGMLKSGDFASFEAGDGGVTSAKAIGGFFMMWPLFSISNTDYISDSQRIWAKGRLVFVSEMLGLNHAKVLSGFYLRLPSMIIRRDIMMSMVPSNMGTGAVVRAFSPPVAANMPQHITTSTISKLAKEHGFNTNSQQQQLPYGKASPPQNYAASQSYTANQPVLDTSSEQHYIPNQNSSTSSPQNYTTDTQQCFPDGTGHTAMENAHAEMSSAMSSATSGLPTYAMTPLQQREAMLKENWENERRNLLKKASNQQGESVERLLANYFLV
ncbi:uncharacterized protein L3040_008724 [Drepanopeziza brunnea f. sp. 'multigermtubi']|uniref:uncharacterized protein n=1 Tax=Drepanopeziza brunnea f. sp. 'multigermtubi' TaxID=698441 RepID=UPI00238F032C|nr:hypothetical protein L3040_008724 [Drepanopeziza brunnea f. sp. 'multigermtubi']